MFAPGRRWIEQARGSERFCEKSEMATKGGQTQIDQDETRSCGVS